MSIRLNALRWLESKHGKILGSVYTSKYYLPEESWPKTHVWWLQIPRKVINSNLEDYINLICQVTPGKIDFHYLKVPIKYLQEHPG